MANDKNIEKVFDLSPDNKVLWFRGKKIDLTGTNKIFQVDSLYWRWLFYNKAETTPEDPNYPIPDSSGKIILFNRKKNELGNKGEFKENTQEAGSLPDNNYGLIMALGIKFLPFLDVATLEALQKANYRLVIKKVDSQARVESSFWT
jgi:hypothetical protein